MTIDLRKQRLQQIKRTIPYLAPGNYSFDTELRILFHQDHPQDPLLETRLATPTAEPVAIPFTATKDADYHLVWFGINGDLKLFSDQTVLTIATNKENYWRKLDNHQFFQNYFSMPHILDFDDRQLLILEERLFGDMPRLAEADWLIQQITTDYLAYFQQLQSDKRFTCRSFQEILATSPNRSYQSEFQWLMDSIPPELLHHQWPMIRVHGDLWTENLLLPKTVGAGGLFYLDWDEAVPHLFFFDFFKLLWNELDVHQSEYYLQHYLKGTYDKMLQEWFACFGLIFDPNQRNGYMNLFFLDFLLGDTPSYPYTGKRYELADYQKKVFPIIH